MHKILIAVWHMLSTDLRYNDLGPDYLHNRPGQLQRRRARLVNELAEIETSLAAGTAPA